MPKKPKGNGHSAYDNVIDVYNCKYSLIISIRPLPVENGRLENRGRRDRDHEIGRVCRPFSIWHFYTFKSGVNRYHARFKGHL